MISSLLSIELLFPHIYEVTSYNNKCIHILSQENKYLLSSLYKSLPTQYIFLFCHISGVTITCVCDPQGSIFNCFPTNYKSVSDHLANQRDKLSIRAASDSGRMAMFGERNIFLFLPKNFQYILNSLSLIINHWTQIQMRKWRLFLPQQLS